MTFHNFQEITGNEKVLIKEIYMKIILSDVLYAIYICVKVGFYDNVIYIDIHSDVGIKQMQKDTHI